MSVKIFRIPFLILPFILLGAPNFTWANSQDACKRISEGALITQTKVLVIGVEGFLSFSATGTKSAYEHRCRVSRGLASRTPKVLGGGYVLENLIIPLIDDYKNKVEVVVVPHGDAGSKGGKAYHCAKAWMSEKRPGSEGRKVILVGHSFGGYALPKLTGNLGEVPVAGVLSIDPRLSDGPLKPKMKRQGKVDRWENYFQVFPLRGYEIEGADVNKRLEGKGHTGLPGHPTVKSALRSMIGNPSGPATIVGQADDCKAVPGSKHTGIFKHQGTELDPNMKSPSGISGVTKGAGVDEQKPQPPKKLESGIGKIPVPEKAPRSNDTVVTAGSAGKCPKGFECRWDYNIFTGEKVYVQKPAKDLSGGSQMGVGRNPSAIAESVIAESVQTLNGIAEARPKTRLQMDSITAAAKKELSESPQPEGELPPLNSAISGEEMENVWGMAGSSSSAKQASVKNSHGVVVGAILQSKASDSVENENLFSRVKKKIREQMSNHP